VASRRIAKGCGHILEAGVRTDARWCSPACRQSAYRRRVNPELRPRHARPRLLPGRSVDASAPERDHRESSPAVVRLEPDRIARSRAGARSTLPPHLHRGRLCAVCTTAAHLEVRVTGRKSPELLAGEMRRAGGDYGPAMDAGYSYRHALRIRAGWRGAGRTGAPVPYDSRGYHNGYPVGRSPEQLARYTGRPVPRPSHGRDVLAKSRVALLRGAELASLAARLLELSRAAR
jgi:hypothetical protein